MSMSFCIPPGSSKLHLQPICDSSRTCLLQDGTTRFLGGDLGSPQPGTRQYPVIPPTAGLKEEPSCAWAVRCCYGTKYLLLLSSPLPKISC